MATKPKTDAKTEARQEAKTEATQVVIDGNTEPSHKYKTWMLKVSVHCEQCKRKVKKVLDSIDGVYSTDIDLGLQKATVVGDVDADTLIKRLKKKTRKHVELWPEKAVGDQKEAMKKDKAKNKEKGKEKVKQRDQESSNEAGGDGEKEREIKDKAEAEKMQVPSTKNSEIGSPSNNSEGGGHVVTGKACEGGGAVQAKEVKVNAKQPVTSPYVGQSPVADKKVGESEVVVEKSGGGGSADGSSGGKKKKGQKGKNGNNNNGDEGVHSGHAPAGTGSSGQGDVQVQAPPPANHIPPYRDYVYDYPTTYYAPPVYAASSNVAYPSTSYGASYYAPQHSYAYMHPGTHPDTFSEPPPYDFHQYSSQPSDSFDFLSDENPNACSIM
ncbi:hypothetical protein SADUNF_Sadunf13G0015600 [Salix dunnii]|uniref:HMA domain-containing protein n=1 Tax=Salix dunnii TaxID=1413687 RepID=A0A835JHR6_9ROSI|nr:hypothetical protein SADUNF_Sadunf13G0015600 [Salix dunnii]